jgi:hypothetical protein
VFYLKVKYLCGTSLKKIFVKIKRWIWIIFTINPISTRRKPVCTNGAELSTLR